MKMKIKDFDAKKFLIEKGERVGLYVAAGLMGLMLIFGLKSVFTSSANANASSLLKLNEGKRTLIANSEPQGKPEEGKPADPKSEYGMLVTPERRIMGPVELVAVDPGKWPVSEPFFVPGKVPGDKRLSPLVKTPVEFKSAVALAQLDGYRFSDDHERIWVLEGVGGTGSGPDMFQKDRSNAQNLYGGPMQAMMQQQRQQASKSPGGPGGPGGMQGSMPKMGNIAGGPTEGAKGTAKLVKIDELEKLQGAKLMEDVYPRRIAVIAASFPYKEQLEEFRQKLRFKTLPELFADRGSPPAFTGVDVDRAEIVPGQPEDKAVFQPAPVAKAVQQLILFSGKRFEDDPPELEPVSFDGLVMDRPKQFRDGEYPKIELQLKHIEETLAALKNAKEAQIAKPKNRFTDDDLNPFQKTKGGTQTTKGTAPGTELSGTPKLPTKGTGPTPDGSPGGSQQWIFPDYCLVRVLDPTIEPGKTYKYKLRIRMANPNYKRPDVAWASLADTEEITSDFVDVPGTVTVPPEVLYYAVDMRTVAQDKPRDAELRPFLNVSPPGPGQVAVQVHRWLESIMPDPNLTYMVGDWAIAERLLLNRGEYMTRKARVEVPIRDVNQDKFTLAASKGARRSEKRVEVFFGSDSGPDPKPTSTRDPILVDFQGGLIEYNQFAGVKDDKADYSVVRDKAPIEVVMMTPDGKLHVHDGEVDLKDKERADRYRAWKDRVKVLKEDNKPATDKTSPLNPLTPGGK